MSDGSVFCNAKRLRILDFSDLNHLAECLLAFAEKWNTHAHPFNWSAKSALKVMAKWEAQSRVVQGLEILSGDIADQVITPTVMRNSAESPLPAV